MYACIDRLISHPPPSISTLQIPAADDEWLRRRCWDKTALEDNWRKFKGGFVSVVRAPQGWRVKGIPTQFIFF